MSTTGEQIATSVLVIGTGGSGLRASIELAEHGVDVLLVGKRPKTDAHTTLAAGGINAALATMDAEDSWQQHAADTIRESYLLADPMTVQVVTEGAAAAPTDHGTAPSGVPDIDGPAVARHHDHAHRDRSYRALFDGRRVVRAEDHGTGVEGLYAIGEASSGLHGANRLGGNSLIELLVYGKIVGQAAAHYSSHLNAQQRSRTAVSAVRDEIDQLLSSGGSQNVRFLQRALRNTMTEHAGVVRDEDGLLSGLRELADVEDGVADLGVHPDIAGFYDLAHAFDLKSGVTAARATLETAVERRETRGCHNRSDYPELDPALTVNMVWSGPGRIDREVVGDIPDDIAARMREVSTVGKLVE